MNWKTIIDNKALIDKTARNIVRGSSLNVEDFLQQVYINIAENLDTFDPSKGSFSTFVYWRIRATKKSMLKKFMKHSTNSELSYDLGTEGHTEIENKVELSIVMSKMTEGEIFAAQTVLDGIKKKDLKEQAGISYFARQARLYRFRDRLSRGDCEKQE